MRSVVCRIDRNLYAVIQDVQQQIKENKNKELTFAQASRILAVLYYGIDITKKETLDSVCSDRYSTNFALFLK